MQSLFNTILTITIPFFFFLIHKNTSSIHYNEWIFAFLTICVNITSFQIYKYLKLKYREKLYFLFLILIFQLSLIIFYTITSVQPYNTKVYFITFLSLPVIINFIEIVKLNIIKLDQPLQETELNNV